MPLLMKVGVSYSIAVRAFVMMFASLLLPERVAGRRHGIPRDAHV
jgi:hypothetical protein